MRRTVMLVLLLSACVDRVGRSAVVSAASFDHDCPKEKVTIVTEADGVDAYVLDVCGKRRKYRNFGPVNHAKFVDVTDGTPVPPP